jgi:hypothetical protein
MAHMKFQEYLDRNKKLTTSAPVKKIADFEGKIDTKPVKEKKHKDAGGKGQDGEIKPYKGGSDAQDPNKGKLKDGFADKGDKKLKYEPDTAHDGNGPGKGSEGVPGGKKAATWPKTKTQEWVDRTKGMSLAEFTKTVRAEALKGLDECACQDSPHNSIKETIAVCKCNQKYVSALVREMKRNGLFGKLMKEMVNHPETFKALAILMERDEMYARKLAKAMNEMVAPPMGDEHGGMDLGGPPMHKPKKKKHLPPHPHADMLGGDDDMGMGGDDDMGEEMPHPDDMHDDDMGDDDLGMGGDDDDMGGDMPHPDDLGGDDMGMGDDDLGIGGGDDMPPPHNDKIGKLPMKKKKPKLGAHHHLMAAMKDHPALMGGGM